MKLTSILASAILAGSVMTAVQVPFSLSNSLSQAVAETIAVSDDIANLTPQRKIDNLSEVKGKKASGYLMRSYFAGDLEPIGIQPGGAGMVVNFYNKAGNITVSYCSTYDVVVAVKSGKIAKFAAAEVK
ncbi:DUF3887 domain-containing protein [Tumidithrix helvetica PCC 7403]|uniref:hypothetical protein n=1 Tax=Tumidithrix helvetica TaxID=3457545 RepID=UPI003C8A8980